MSDVPAQWHRTAAEAWYVAGVVATHEGHTLTADQIIDTILRRTLGEMRQEVESLVPDESGRVSKGLVLAILLGELDGWREKASEHV